MSLLSFPSSLKNPITYWLGWIVCETQQCVGLKMEVWLWLCVSQLFHSTLWNHPQLGGGSDAGRLMRTLAYGWVEHCSDVASCGPTSSQDEYSCVFYLYICTFL